MVTRDIELLPQCVWFLRMIKLIMISIPQVQMRTMIIKAILYMYTQTALLRRNANMLATLIKTALKPSGGLI